MQPFLSKAADFVLSKSVLSELHKTCIIVPSRRAVGFMKRAIAQKANGAFLAPEIVSIDDFIVGYSGLQVADNLSLIFELYAAYSEIDSELSFEKFIAWAPTVLTDFDLIDQYLVENPAELFAYMTEVEALKRWNVEVHDAQYHQTVEQYFTRFSDLGKVYNTFKARLQVKGLGYRGMAYRLFAEEIENYESEVQKFKHYYFIGLNALSKAEIVIIDKLVQAKKASCFWDQDVYFMKGKHQAGSVLRKYQKDGKFGEWNESDNLLLTDAKEVNFLNSPSESLQAKIASNCLKDCKQGKTVMVVPDEKMIPSVLFSLGNDVADFNISMGLGLGVSKWSRLLSLLFEMQSSGFYGHDKLNTAYIIALAKDSLLNSVSNQYAQDLDVLAKQIQKNNLLFISKDQIPNGLDLFFAQWQSTQECVASIDSIFYTLKSLLEVDLDFIEKEFFYAFDNVLASLKTQVIAHPTLSIVGVQLLLKELYNSEKVAFEGDPEASLQIMSLLETRCLDFENVIFLSFNEGVIPSSNKSSSFLPFEACLHYNIPIYRDQDAIMNYHFLRLLMRADKMEVIFSSSANGSLGSKSEESRFAKQLRNDLLVQNKNIISKSLHVAFTAAEGKALEESISIIKGDTIVAHFKTELKEKGLSPTSLTQYLKCPLQFYFKRIAKIKTEDTLEEGIGYDVYGNWIHNSLELLGKDFFGSSIINPEKLQEAAELVEDILDRVIHQDYKGYDISQGWNYIFRQMAVKSIKGYLTHRKDQSKSFKINGVEEFLSSHLDIDGTEVKIKGTIDSIEEFDNHIELVDYKTGKAESKDINASKLDEFFLKGDKDKHRQLLIYLFLYHQNNPKTVKDIKARIYSFRNFNEDIQLQIPIDQANVVVLNGVKNVVSEMVNPEVAISQTDDLEICSYCDFKTICNR